MAKKKNRGGKIYAVCLSLYVVLLAALIIYGLSVVWAYAVEYENAVPDTVIDEYVADLSENLWDDSIAATIAEMPHEVQSNEECAEIVQDMLRNDIDYVRMAKKNSADPTLQYKLRCGGNDFGVVTLVEDESKLDSCRFGMLPWKVQKEEFDFTGLYSSVEVVVPAAFSVKLNDVKLGEEYIVERDIPYDVLENDYERYPNLPTKVKYKFDNVIGHLEPVIYDENDNETVIDTEKDDSQFLVMADEAEFAKLSDFVNEFIARYKEYISGQYSPDYGYQRLLPYIKKDSELDVSMKMAQDGIYWSNQHSPLLVINSITLNNAIYIGDGVYFLSVTNDTTVTKGDKVDNRIENMRIIVIDSGNEIRAVALDLID